MQMPKSATADFAKSRVRGYALARHRGPSSGGFAATFSPGEKDKTRKDRTMLLSESARVTTAQEAKFRIQYPNSKPRAVKVIALDTQSAKLVDEVSTLPWNGAAFFKSLSFDAAKGTNVKAWLNDLAGQTADLATEVANADCVVVISGAGQDAHSVSLIAELCTQHHKTLVALVVPQDATRDEEIDASLRILRPHAKMLVIAHGRDYIEAMLTALRA